MVASFKRTKCWMLAEKSTEQDSGNRALVDLMIENLEERVGEQGVN